MTVAARPIILLFPLSLACASCGGGGVGSIQTTPSGLAGHYAGTWTQARNSVDPADSGTFDFVVARDGMITGTGSSLIYGSNRPLYGTLQPGVDLDLSLLLRQDDTFFFFKVFEGPLRVDGQSLRATFREDLTNPSRTLVTTVQLRKD